MKRNSIVLQTFLMLVASLSALSLSAMEVIAADKPDFVLAAFTTNRARADLLEKATAQNILAYNVNWQSTVDISNKVIKNVWVRSKGKWVRAPEMPLPDAVYDFGVYKKSQSKKEAARLIKKQLRELSFGKWC